VNGGFGWELGVRSFKDRWGGGQNTVSGWPGDGLG